MLNQQQDLVDAVVSLPVERQDEIRQFISLLNKNDEIIKIAMQWIIEELPDRYCAGEPKLDVQKFQWRVPVILCYPNGKNGAVSELVIDARNHHLIHYTMVREIRKEGRRLAGEFTNAR